MTPTSAPASSSLLEANRAAASRIAETLRAVTLPPTETIARTSLPFSHSPTTDGDTLRSLPSVLADLITSEPWQALLQTIGATVNTLTSARIVPGGTVHSREDVLVPSVKVPGEGVTFAVEYILDDCYRYAQALHPLHLSSKGEAVAILAALASLDAVGDAFVRMEEAINKLAIFGHGLPPVVEESEKGEQPTMTAPAA